MEQQLVDLQKEYDESKEECLGHQKVIQELKSSLEQANQVLNQVLYIVQKKIDFKISILDFTVKSWS